ncbi:g2181 [Coccomyxa elongata]
MDGMNFSGVMPSNLNISTLDAWAADYLGQEQKSIQGNFRFFKEVYGLNLTCEDRVALMQQIPADLVLDTLALFIREALYEQLPPEQRISARQRPYPPQVPAAVVHALTRQEKQQPCLFKLRQDAVYPQQCTPRSTRPSKTGTVHQARCKLPPSAGMDFAGAGIWVGGLSRHVTIGEIWRGFSIFGKVVDVSLPKYSDELPCCKWTFVNFASPKSSKAALTTCEHAATDMTLYQMMQGIQRIMADPSLPLEVRRWLPPI